ncbi:MAG: ATP-binding cassette domain-containing protein [Pseudomonadota bacterium]
MANPNSGSSDETESVIALDGITLTLPSKAGAVEILKGISLDVPTGQSLAIVGPSGSGKTSLLMIMAGLERATTGRASVAGHDFSAMSEDALAEARGRDIGIVFQAFHLIPTMTAIENVALPLELTGRRDTVATATARLQDVGLSDRLQHYPAQLSGGEQQRVALARALAPSPRVLFADEPTGNLDHATGEQVIELLFGLQTRDNATLVLVTHDEELASRCDRVIRMADGVIAADGDTSSEAASRQHAPEAAE